MSAGAGCHHHSCMVMQGQRLLSSCVHCCMSLSPSPCALPPSCVSPACVSPPCISPLPCISPSPCISPPCILHPPRVSHPPCMLCFTSSSRFVSPCHLFTYCSHCALLSPHWHMFLNCSLSCIVASLAPDLVCLLSCVLVMLSFHVVVGSLLCCVVVVGL